VREVRESKSKGVVRQEKLVRNRCEGKHVGFGFGE
jgi:hypothetical protein